MMIGFYIVLGIILGLIYVIMMSMMIIFERDKPKNIIIWSVVFVTTQVVGYVIYVLIRHVFYKKRNSLKTKQQEDEIYDKLISNKIYDNESQFDHDVFEFNRMAYNAKITSNNHIDIINNREEFKENIINDIRNAKKYIILERKM